MKRKLIVTIDGPAGAGKSTIARMVSKKLGYLNIDTGAMYRAIAWKSLQKKIDLQKEETIVQLAQKTKIALKQDRKGGSLRVLIDGKDMSDKIRTETVSRQANLIAVIQGVREVLKEKQRAMGKKGGVVMEGRDIGTEVFPDADIKFYLDASPTERAQRRYRELKVKGKKVNLKQITSNLAQRDYKDQHRSISPLKPAENAIIIDSTNLTLDEVAQTIVNQTTFR